MTMIIDGTNGATFPDSTSQATGYTNSVGFRNRIINGDMRIDQRNAGASVTQSNTVDVFAVDRWKLSGQQNAKFTAQQNAGSVTPPTGFVNYLGVTSSSAYSVLTNDDFSVTQLIEGFNASDLGWGAASAQSITLSFKVRSSLTGTFGGAISNSAANRSYPFSYTISAANTWEDKTITIPGDTTGTWLTTNGIGLRLWFSLGAGSGKSGTSGVWAAADYRAPTGAVSVVGTNGATFYITGVQLEAGSVATPFERRPYGTELALCQRYYYKQQSVGTSSYFGLAYNYATTAATGIIPFPVQMRSAPSALEQSGTAGDYRILYLTTSATCNSVPTFNSGDVFSATVNFVVASGLTAGQASLLRSVNSTAYLAWSAEL